MKERLLKSAAASLEWRVFAFIITGIFFWFMTGAVWQATILAIELQIILFIAHFGWFYFRETRPPKS
ncbi:hypothetical protein L0Y34_00965 [Candidatus Parcubacteria bacterium]|nr:hypothetical protein [Candidatus Parcubacteria bacterium]